MVTLKTEIGKLVQSLQIVSGIVDANSETTVRGQKPQLMGQINFKKVEFGYDDETKILKNVKISIAVLSLIAAVVTQGVIAELYFFKDWECGPGYKCEKIAIFCRISNLKKKPTFS